MEVIMSKTIGIDLGTTNSVVAYVEGGKPEVILNNEGNRTTPSVVAYTKEGQILAGQVAKRQAITNPENTVYSVKRFMGSQFSEVEKEAEKVPYQVQASKDQSCQIKVKGEVKSPPEISAEVLIKLKQAAEEFLGEKVTDAVITVPAYFNDSQRQATVDAGKIAGLDVKRIINEPTAAALAYGLDKKQEGKIAVFDFGGGTFDVSILELGDSVVEVLSTNGDTHLGGDNIDEILMDHVMTLFKKEQGIDLAADPMAKQRLKEAVEKAKIELSTTMETDINLPFITADNNGPKHLNVQITRSQFEKLIEGVLEDLKKPCLSALEDAGMETGEIDEVILVGGSTRIPKVQKMVQELFGKEPNKGVNPDEVVAMGAAIQAGVLAGDVADVLLLDVTPLSLGIETLGGVMTKLIDRNSTIPIKKTEVFSTARDNQTSVGIKVLQGEREFAGDNRILGQFQLSGIAPAERGMPQIEVAFDIDANGIVNVSAIDKNTGQKQAIVIEAGSGLTEDEINRAVKQAEENQVEDRKRREKVEAINLAESTVNEVERTLKSTQNSLQPDVMSEMNHKVEQLKSLMKTADATTLTQAVHNLQQELANSLQKGQTMNNQQGTPSHGGEEDVVDAEYTQN